MPMQLSSGHCGVCSRTDTEVVYQGGLALWHCKDCLFEAVKNGKLEPGTIERTCAGCGGKDEDIYCSSCSECEEAHGSAECNECYEDAQYCRDHANIECKECGSDTVISVCPGCQEGACEECEGDNESDKAVCRVCFDAKASPNALPTVIIDDSAMQVGEMEVRWN